MSNQWPDIKKEMDKISVPVDRLDLIITNVINENRIKRSKKKVALYSLSAAVLGFGVFLGSASAFPAMAKIASQMPIIGTFFNSSNDEGLRIAGKKGLTQIVNQSSKDNGITLTINEIFYDGTRLTLGYTKESLFAIGELERPTIEVNGKEINFSSGYSGEFLTPQQYKGMIEIIPTEELPEEFEMKIRVDAVGVIPGKWQFEFPVKQSNTVTVIKPKKTKSIEQAEVQISSLKLGPAGTDLLVNVKQDRETSKFDPYMLAFYLIDEQGNVLDTLMGSGSGEVKYGKENVNLNFLYSPLKEGTKKVRVIPYTVPIPEDGLKAVSVPLDQNLPIVLDQGDFGKIVITDITYQKDMTVVQFDVQSDAILENDLSSNSIWLVNGKGKIIDSKPAERINGNHYKQEFATRKIEGLLLKTRQIPKPIMYEEFEIEIP